MNGTWIDAIRSAELEAARTIAAARLAAERTVERAHDEAKVMVTRARDIGSEQATAHLAAATEGAERTAAGITIQDEVDRCRAAVSACMPELVEAMVQLVLAAPGERGS